MSDEPSNESILTECCKWLSPAALLLSDRPVEIQARFAECSPADSVISLAVCELGTLESIDDIRLGQHCAVTFGYANRPRFFIAVIKDHYVEDEKTLIELPLPKKIALAEVRRAVRVPLIDDLLDLELMIEDDEILRPRVKNLSLTGMLIAFDKVVDPKLYPFDKVGLLLRHGDESVALRGIVRRCEPCEEVSYYGLMFPETNSGDIPESLQRMVELVEQKWHDSNV